MKIIPNAVTQKVARQVLIASKHSPRIMFVAGVAGVVTSTVLACRATLQVSEIVDDIDYEVHDLKRYASESEHYKKDLVYIYAKGAYRIGKIYAPAVIIGGTSIAALTGSHVTLTRRNASLTAAYAAVSKGLEEYRERVKDEVGIDREFELYRGITTQEIIDENGKKIKAKVLDPNKMTMYARLFDEYSRNWQKNSELNKLFILCQQNYANDLLQIRGHVFLNEVYESLGIPHSKAGATVGWTLGNGGDNYIDFGIFEAYNSDFIDGQEKSIWLDFNVDGVILDFI